MVVVLLLAGDPDPSLNVAEALSGREVAGWPKVNRAAGVEATAAAARPDPEPNLSEVLAVAEVAGGGGTRAPKVNGAGTAVEAPPEPCPAGTDMG